jgi:predicted transcriptional regulator
MSENSVEMAAKPPKRSDSNTTLTISMSKELRERIELAAKDDQRTISSWCSKQLKELLDRMDAMAEGHAHDRSGDYVTRGESLRPLPAMNEDPVEYRAARKKAK